jgi:hypothetical protein
MSERLTARLIAAGSVGDGPSRSVRSYLPRAARTWLVLNLALWAVLAWVLWR